MCDEMGVRIGDERPLFIHASHEEILEYGFGVGSFSKEGLLAAFGVAISVVKYLLGGETLQAVILFFILVALLLSLRTLLQHLDFLLQVILLVLIYIYSKVLIITFFPPSFLL